VVISDHGQAAYLPTAAQSFLDLSTLVSFLGLQHDVVPVRIANQHYLHFQNPGRIRQTEQLLRGAFISTAQRPLFHEITRADQRLCFQLASGSLDEDEDAHIVFPGYGQLSTRALRMEKGPPVTSVHILNGLVALYGRDVRPGGTLDNASILDVTPTLLTLFDLPLARDMTGRVWWEALDLDRATTERYVDSYKDEFIPCDASPAPLTPEELTALRDRLRDLGYV
jgi:hypothetical protein